jgi:hypothetical protein
MSSLFKIRAGLLGLFVLMAVSRLEAGKFAGEFLALGSGARGLAMGQAMTALSDDPFSCFWNPAGLALVDRRSVSGMATSHFGSLTDPMGSMGHVGLTWPIGGGNLALNLLHFQVTDIPRYPELGDDEYTFEERRAWIEARGGDPLGTFENADQAVYFSFAKRNRFTFRAGWLYRELPVELPYGINFKVIRSSLDDDEGLGVGVDAGIQARVRVEDMSGIKGLGEFSLGARFDNFTNTGLRWDGGQDAIHYYHVLGAAWKLRLGGVGLTLSHDWDHHYDTRQHSGLELDYLRRLFLRLGHQGRDGRMTYGAGFVLGALTLDYAGLDHDLGRLHRMSFQWTF